MYDNDIYLLNEFLFKTKEDKEAKKDFKKYKKYKRRGGKLSYEDYRDINKRKYESFVKASQSKISYNDYLKMIDREMDNELHSIAYNNEVNNAKILGHEAKMAEYRNKYAKRDARNQSKLLKYEAKQKRREASYLIPNKKERIKYSGIPKARINNRYNESLIELLEDLDYMGYLHELL